MIYLVRHGEAAASWGDHPDPGLSELGQKQAAVESLAKLLAKEWPSRFGNVHRDARKKLGNLEKKAG